MRLVSVFFVFAALTDFAAAAATQFILTVQGLNNMNRGTEYISELRERVFDGVELSDAEALLVGFELMRSTHLAFCVTQRYLVDEMAALRRNNLRTKPRSSDAAGSKPVGSLMSEPSGSTSEAVPDPSDAVPDAGMIVVDSPAVEALAAESFTIVNEIQHRYPIPVGEDWGSPVRESAQFAVDKMFQMASDDVVFIESLFKPGSTTVMLEAYGPLPHRIDMAQTLTAMLRQAAVMMEWLSVITRDAERIPPMQEALINAAVLVSREMDNVLGSHEYTKTIEQGLFKVFTSCTAYKSALLGNRESGIDFSENFDTYGPAMRMWLADRS